MLKIPNLLTADSLAQKVMRINNMTSTIPVITAMIAIVASTECRADRDVCKNSLFDHTYFRVIKWLYNAVGSHLFPKNVLFMYSTHSHNQGRSQLGGQLPPKYFQLPLAYLSISFARLGVGRQGFTLGGTVSWLYAPTTL